MLKSEQKKLDRIGIKINSWTDINGYRYWVDTNMNNKYFTVNVCRYDKETGNGIAGTNETLCTRALLNTAIEKVRKHIEEHR